MDRPFGAMGVAGAVERVTRPLAGFADVLASTLAAERERWALWLPAGIGAGIALYFSLAREPDPAWGPAALGLALAGALAGVVRVRRRGAGQGLIVVAAALGSVALGFTVVKMHADAAAAPVIERRTGPVVLEGRIAALEAGLKGPRVTLEALAVGRLLPERTPDRVRLRVRSDLSGFAIGDRIGLRAVLMPPPGPSAPGAFDFARDAWFQGLGAVGYGVSRPHRVSQAPEAAPPRLLQRFRDRVATLRRGLHERITGAIGGTTGAVASALMTGERGDIPPADMEAMRQSGLAHLLAISGLHIGLVTGALFFGLRALLAMWPAVALRYPIKKWAAGAALLGGFGYMLMTGATVPTQRAFLMAGLVLTAVMLDRAAVSMRLVAWAAAAVLLMAPESLTGPSFQMSFAAVIALVATYEGVGGAFARLRGEHGGLGRRLLAYGLAVALTTLVAGMATAPFALYHFNRVAMFGLAANLGAVPVTALWIMPWATLAYLLAPLGLETLALVPMGWGIDAVLAIARAVAAWPGAAMHLPGMPVSALALMAVGGLWLALWRSRVRLAGIAAIVAGVLVAVGARAPDVLVAGDAASFATRGPDGELLFGWGRIPRFERETWLRRAGLPVDDDDAVDGASTGEVGPGGDRSLRCDALACIYRAGRHVVSFVRAPEAALEDCHRADVVVALVPLRGVRCRAPRVVVGRFDLWREGAHALWLDDDRVRVRSVAGERGRRPWVLQPRPRQPAD